MIWIKGRVVVNEAIAVSVLDRTFEHGLGLFETFRTWEGHPTLLDRHLARMLRSSADLDLWPDPAGLPDADAVARLLRASRIDGDAMLRITMTGGSSSDMESVIWMTAGALPPEPRRGGIHIEPRGWAIAPGDPLAGYKSLNYWRRRLAFEGVRKNDRADESLSYSEGDGCVWEGSRTNLFIARGGVLTTPSLDQRVMPGPEHPEGRVPGPYRLVPRKFEGRIVPGVMRAVVLERAWRDGIVAVERPVSLTELMEADEVFLTNSVRGIIPVAGTPEEPNRWPKHDLAHQLWTRILPRLIRGEDIP